MTLDEKVWNYESITPDNSFKRGEFVSGMGDFEDLGSYLKKLHEEPRDPKTISDLGKLLYGDSFFFDNSRNPSLAARIGVDRALSETTENMARYVKNNVDEFYDKISDKDALGLVTSLPLYKQRDKDANSEHNKFVDALGAVREVSQIMESKDLSKVRGYVGKRMNAAPKWLQESFAMLAGDEGFVHALFSKYAENAERNFQGLFVKDGNIDRDYLLNRFKDSLEVAWEEHNDESNEGDKGDIWEDAIRPYYLALAQTIYPGEKKKEKMKRDRDREERKAERKKLGMPA